MHVLKRRVGYQFSEHYLLVFASFFFIYSWPFTLKRVFKKKTYGSVHMSNCPVKSHRFIHALSQFESTDTSEQFSIWVADNVTV